MNDFICPKCRGGLLLLSLLWLGSCKETTRHMAVEPPAGTIPTILNHASNLPFDSLQVKVFYDSFPLLAVYRPDVEEVYRRHNFTLIWHDGQGIVESGLTLFNKTKGMDVEGVAQKFPYQEKVNGIFENELENTLGPVESDLMITNLYLFYAETVIRGQPDTTTKALGWLLPRKQISYAGMLDSALKNPGVFSRDDNLLIGQYYRLRDVLKHYREIETKGLWPVNDTIRRIIVNMERCRWIPPEFARSEEYVVVNIPAFMLTFVRNGKIALRSPVVVGKTVTKTVIFSGMMSQVVFNPYWNVPQSIINKEIKPGMVKDPDYLAKHNMEWNNGQVRQKPGKNNSLGLVKFLFPNSNDIYIHDTPAKSLFGRESRAFSHGCIRVGKPRELAIEALKEDPEWTPEKIDRAMRSGQETPVTLKKKIPVHIGYFTAWIDDAGTLRFFDDIYGCDDRLANLLFAQTGSAAK